MRLFCITMIPLMLLSLATGHSSEPPRERFFVLQPFGQVDERLLETLRRFVEAAYGQPCKVMKAMDLPPSAFDPRRKQYNASELLSALRSHFFLKRLFKPGIVKAVGVTEKDIYTRQMNFIFGLATRGGKYCVISTCRFHQSFRGKPVNEKLLRRRTLKVLYHELGHNFGMPHCDRIQCAMCYHNSLPELDESYVWFCPDCTKKLEKLVGGFSKNREVKLAKLLTDLGLTADARRHKK
jgi:archaemetzincin